MPNLRIQANLPHGRGRYRSEDGAGHWGSWKAGQRHGLGIRVGAPADGSATTFAQFDADVMLGNAVEIPAGNLLDDASDTGGPGLTDRARPRTGQGICTFDNGDAYVVRRRTMSRDAVIALPCS